MTIPARTSSRASGSGGPGLLPWVAAPFALPGVPIPVDPAQLPSASVEGPFYSRDAASTRGPTPCREGRALPGTYPHPGDDAVIRGSRMLQPHGPKAGAGFKCGTPVAAAESNTASGTPFVTDRLSSPGVELSPASGRIGGVA